MIKDENYITIQAWMRKDLNLKGNELMVYAIIYGFCQDGASVYSGSCSYLSEWIGVDKKTVRRLLQGLVSKGFLVKIDKIVNGVKLCDYSVNKMPPLGTKCPYPGDKMSPGGGDKMSPHNTNIDNNIRKEEMYKEEIPPEGYSPSLPPQGDSNCPAAHFKDLWNNRLVVNYSNAYPANVKIPRITTAEIKNLSVRDTELKKLVKELLADGIITQAELDAVDGDRWRWAFKQVWERITKSRFLRGEVYSDGRTPYLFDVTHFLRKDAFVRLVTPVRVSKYCLDDPR